MQMQRSLHVFANPEKGPGPQDSQAQGASCLWPWPVRQLGKSSRNMGAFLGTSETPSMSPWVSVNMGKEDSPPSQSDQGLPFTIIPALIFQPHLPRTQKGGLRGRAEGWTGWCPGAAWLPDIAAPSTEELAISPATQLGQHALQMAEEVIGLRLASSHLEEGQFGYQAERPAPSDKRGQPPHSQQVGRVCRVRSWGSSLEWQDPTSPPALCTPKKWKAFGALTDYGPNPLVPTGLQPTLSTLKIYIFLKPLSPCSMDRNFQSFINFNM